MIFEPLFALSILFFAVLLFSLGFSLLHIFPVKLEDDVFLRLIIYLGTGLGNLVVLIVLFDVVGIPLRWWYFLLLGLVCPVYLVSKRGLRKEKYFSWKKEYWCYCVVLFAVVLLGFTFYQGAYGYPYLEDDDPWGHAVAVKWVAETGSYHQEVPGGISHYLEPYPPSYDAILALAYQINGTVFHTLKVFNVLLLMLGVLFYFIFVKELFGIRVGTVATLVFVALPSGPSHFIWSHTLALTLFPLAMLIAVRSFESGQWFWPAIVMVAAMMVTHPFVAVLFGIFFILLVVWQLLFVWKNFEGNLNKVTFSRNPFSRSFVVGVLGLGFSFIYWGQQLFRHGLTQVLYSHTGGFGGVSQIGEAQSTIEQYINPAYTLYDLTFAPIFAKIDQPTGFGLLAFVLVCCGLFYVVYYWKRFFSREKVHLVVVGWFVLCFVGLMGAHLPFSILTHRFWAYVTIPFAILVGLFVVWLLRKLWEKKVVFLLVSVFLFIGLFGVPFTSSLSLEMNPEYDTSFLVSGIIGRPLIGTVVALDVVSSWQPKKIIANMQWPPGVAWESLDELYGYMWVHDEISGFGDDRVLSLCQEERLLIGFDLDTHFPNAEMDLFRESLSTQTIDVVISLASLYDYVSLEYSCVTKGYLTEEELNALANELASVFDIVYQNMVMVVYKT